MKTKVVNFQAIRQAEIDIRGLTVLVGPTHSGKSAYMNALFCALYNSSSLEDIRVGASEMRICLEMDDQCTWLFTRESSPQVYFKNQKFTKLGRATPVELLGEVGLAPVDVGRGEPFYPNWQMQLQPLFGLGETSTTLFNMLLSFSGLDRLPGARKAVDVDLRENASKERVLKSQVDEGEAYRFTLGVVSERLANPKLDALLDAVARQDAFAPLTALLDGYRHISPLLLATAKWEVVFETVQTLFSKWEPAAELLEEYQRVEVQLRVEECWNNIKEANTAHYLEQTLADLEKQEAELRVYYGLLADWKALQEREEELRKEQGPLDIKLELVTKALEAIDTCAECGAPVQMGVYHES